MIRQEPSAEIEGPFEPIKIENDPRFTVSAAEARKDGMTKAELIAFLSDHFLDMRHKNRWYKFSIKNQIEQIDARNIESLVNNSDALPALVWSSESRRNFWYYQGQFFSENEKLEPEQVQVLILERELKKRRRLERAEAYVAGLETRTGSREVIPDEVKTTVWRRDAGKCASCSSNELLEFDHIIPVSMGGSNTVRNLQLLCEPCNRQKGPNLSK
jgi:hypothetical protein